MEPTNEPTPPEQPRPTEPQFPKKRFDIVKLEERIAPGKGGDTNKPHPCATYTCSCGAY